jgi:hypothetical protein
LVASSTFFSIPIAIPISIWTGPEKFTGLQSKGSPVKILSDTNVVLDIALNRKPFVEHAALLWRLGT